MTKAPSVEPLVRSRLLPRISFRTMLLLTTAAAIVAAIARVAGNGGELAKSVMMGLAFLAACFAAFAFLFLFSWSIAVLRKQCGYAALGSGAVLGLLTIAGGQLPYLTNWYLPSFLILAGFVLLFVPVRESDDLVGNPFAEGQLPPQLLPPREQRT
jgi:hypothetical protein